MNKKKNHNLNILKDVINIIRGFIKEKKLPKFLLANNLGAKYTATSQLMKS
jgi:hypothetical protein